MSFHDACIIGCPLVAHGHPITNAPPANSESHPLTGRCWRLALNCRPQVLPPAPSAPSAADSSDGGPDTPGGEGERALASTSTIPTPLPPLLELAFARADPRTGAEFMTQAFVALHAAGRVVRERALFAM